MNKNIITNEIKRGKSLARAFLNDRLAGYKLEGKCIDLGAKTNSSSYHRLLDTSAASFTFTDREASEGVEVLDLESHLPLEDNTFDTALLFNVLEHIYHHQLLLSEIHRILKDEGKLIGAVPFLVNYHPDPQDYFRYTGESLVILLKEAGYKEIVVEPLGKSMFTAGLNLIWPAVPKILRVGFFKLALSLDNIVLKKKSIAKDRYPLAYYFQAKK